MCALRRTTMWMAAGGAVMLLAGCKGLFAPRGVPQDPLLLSRQPIESRGQVTPLNVMAHHEPMPPADPWQRPALAARPPRTLPALPASRPISRPDE